MQGNCISEIFSWASFIDERIFNVQIERQDCCKTRNECQDNKTTANHRSCSRSINCSTPELKESGNIVIDLSEQSGNINFYAIRNIFTRKCMYMYIACPREYQWLVTGSGSHIITLFKLWEVFHWSLRPFSALNLLKLDTQWVLLTGSWLHRAEKKKEKPNLLAPGVGFDVTTIEPKLHFCNWNFMYQWQVFVSRVRSLTNLCHKKNIFYIKGMSLEVVPTQVQVKRKQLPAMP